MVLARDNNVYWRPGSSGSWNYAGIIANATNWDQFTVNIDLTSDTFSIGYHEIGPNITSTLAPAGTPIPGVGMQDLTHLRWYLTDQVLGGTGGKNFFDDFHFQAVPEPSGISLVLAETLAMLAGKRRRVKQ